jgi:hypothetical protein
LSEVRIRATPATVSTTKDEETSRTYISISPNPAKDILQAGLQSFPAGSARYAISDISGKIVLTGEWQITEDWTTETLKVDALSAGSYILSVQGKDYQRSVSFEVIH